MHILDKLNENYYELIDDFKDMFSESKMSLEKRIIKVDKFDALELSAFINGIKRDIYSIKIVSMVIIQMDY